MRTSKTIVAMAVAGLMLASAAARAESSAAKEQAVTAVAMSEADTLRGHAERNAAASGARGTNDERASELQRLALNTQASRARPSSPPTLVDPRDCAAILQPHMVFVTPSF